MGTAGGQWAILATLGVFILMNVGLLACGGAAVSVEKKRLMVIFWLFLLAAIFWSGFEQAGSSMNLFAQDLTDRTLFGWEMPAGYLQNVNPFFIIVLAPVFGMLWTWLARRDRNPSIPMKFALGLLGLAAGMFVLAWGASYATTTTGSMAWLVVTYFLFTVGELALSPVGLSSMTKLAPPGRLGQMMGVWFIAAALGNLFAGLVAGSLETLAPADAVPERRAVHRCRRVDGGGGESVGEETDRRHPPEVAGLLASLERAPRAERSGRTELLVWSTTYGAWLGVAVPIMADSDSPEAYGIGLLAGAPLGFLAARRYADAVRPTEGQVRAITFGGTWGTYQGLGWLEVLDIGRRTSSNDCVPGFPCDDVFYEEEPSAATRVGAAVAGGLAGIGTGAWLARKPITAGTAAAVSLGGLWGTWFSFGLSVLADLEDDDLLATTLVGGNAAIIATALVAPSWEMSESRARLISVGGLIGALGGAGLLLILQPDNDKVAISIPLVTSAGGLLAAADWTRGMDAAGGGTDNGGADNGGAGNAATGAGASRPAGALLNADGGRWSLDMPALSVRLERTAAVGTAQPAVHVPLFSARFR
jgi:MFS family permease